MSGTPVRHIVNANLYESHFLHFLGNPEAGFGPDGAIAYIIGARSRPQALIDTRQSRMTFTGGENHTFDAVRGLDNGLDNRKTRVGVRQRGNFLGFLSAQQIVLEYRRLTIRCPTAMSPHG